MEIERKWLMPAPPEGYPVLERAVLRQGYLCTKPTVRIRSKEKDGKTGYRLCINGKGTLAREEIEFDIPREKFLALERLLPHPLVRKDYTVYALPGGYRLEYNVVDAGAPTSFTYAEVEFPSIEAAKAFVPPCDFGREVTEEPGYTMGAYWDALLKNA